MNIQKMFLETLKNRFPKIRYTEHDIKNKKILEINFNEVYFEKLIGFLAEYEVKFETSYYTVSIVGCEDSAKTMLTINISQAGIFIRNITTEKPIIEAYI